MPATDSNQIRTWKGIVLAAFPATHAIICDRT